MARQEVNIGVEGNDGTGDSIRESFRKVNENFQELYAVFGIGGQITFTSLSDTPESYTGQGGKIVAVKNDELGVEYLELASNGAITGDAADDSILFNYTVSGKLVLTTAFSSVQSDSAPQLGGPLDANNFGIGKAAVSQAAAQALSNKYGENFTIEDLVITKRHGGEAYLKRGNPGKSANLRDEPANATEYTLTIGSFSGSQVTIVGHGLDSGSNGAGYTYSSTGSAATNLINGNTYYLRVIDADKISLHSTKSNALSGSNPIVIAGGSGTQTLADNSYDSDLSGYWLENEALPRKSVVRRQGDTMTGALYLNDHPGELAGSGTPNGASDLLAASKYYVDNASFTSTTNLYVNTQGDDKQLLTPPGLEGRSLKYAYKSVNAACQKAEELQLAAPYEAGPYMQTVTYANGAGISLISAAGIQTIVSGRETARTLLLANKEFIKAEVIAYINQTYPNFEYDTDICARDIGYILDSVILDALSGNNANYLSRWAGIRYYSSPSAKKAITTQNTETVAGINRAKLLTDEVLQNNPISALQSDVTQTIDVLQVVDITSRSVIAGKFDVVTNTIANGPFDAPNIVDGSVYEINITNGNTGFVDQGDPTNTDLLPGKLVVGKTSGAKGIIVNYIYESDPATSTPAQNDTVELQLVEPVEFIPGEELEFGNTVREKQITVLVEAGVYYEDYPIRVPANVSIKGDEFRRTIIRPKNRSSQSRWANIYFYRDKEFDGLTGDSSSVTGFPDSNLPYTGTAYTNPLTGAVDGYFGYHYLLDPTTPTNVDNDGIYGLTSNNSVSYVDAPELLELNKNFIIEEVIAYINEPGPTGLGFSGSYNETKCRRDTGLIIDAIISDLRTSGREQSLEVQSAYYTGAVSGQEAETKAAIEYIATVAADVISNTAYSGSLQSSVNQTIDTDYTAESGSNTALTSLVNLVAFAFNASYNPARNNLELDAFMMNDATRMSNLTVQGHGGFMVVLDPEGQVLTKSPYIQVGSSFSQSLNRQAFRGGMFIDAFAANIPTRVVSKDDAFTLNVSSNANEGLFFKKPQTPCPFYIDGERFQVNAVREYDPVTGTAKLILDRTSNNGNGFTGTTTTLLNVDLDDLSSPIDITVQSAGNRSMLGNDFTQINDLGYGLVVVNGGLSEMVSMFTYYCWTAFYAKNGAEIRSLNGSNANGEYGLVSEGADPNEIPDAVTLRDNMIQPIKTAVAEVILEFNASSNISLAAGTTLTQATSGATGVVVFDAHSTYGTKVLLRAVTGTFDTTNAVTPGAGTIAASNVPSKVTVQAADNVQEQLSIHVYDFEHPIQNRGELELYHSGAGSIGRYEASNVQKLEGVITGAHFGLSDSVSGVTDNGTGTGAEFTVGKTVRNGYVIYDISGTGTGYTAGDTIDIVGTIFGGTSPANDAQITIDTVSGSGVITSASVTGTVNTSNTIPYFNGQVVKVNFSTGTSGFSNDGLIENTDEDINVIHRMNGNFVFGSIADTNELVIRPSTAVQFDESVETTYRSIAFNLSESTGEDLAANNALTSFDINYDYIRLVVDATNATDTTAGYINGGTTCGATLGDRAIAVLPLTESAEKTRLGNGDMIFTWDGKSFQIDEYVETGGSFDVIKFSDVANSDVNVPATATGLPSPIVLGSNTVTIRAGLPASADATITINISTCRATGHDFLDIGTGGFNTSNYPNVLLGLPRTPSQANEVQERNKGRVFFVSTDQDGIFRVGKFFTVDQGTGTVTFSASIALSNLDGIGFKRGVVVAEFSTDDGMVNNAPDTVPVQSAVRGYVNRRLGFDHVGDPVSNVIGPGVLPLNGSKNMAGTLNMGANNITNIAAPTSGTDATNKNYVDSRITNSDSIPEMKNTLVDAVADQKMVNVAGGQLFVTTGYKRIFIDADLIGGTGVFTVGQNFEGNVSGGQGTIVQILTGTDDIYGNVQIIVYEKTNATEITTSDTIVVSGGPTGPVLDGPFDEMANGVENASNEIDITITRNTTDAELALTYKAGSIVNADINASAAISQSKLAMNAATTRANATGITQNDLGLVSFDSDDFSVTNGWVTLKANDVDFADLPQIATNKALGNVSGSTGNISAIDITTTGAADSLVRTQSDGSIRVNSLRLGGTNTYQILSLASTTVNFKTPGQATILSASGSDSSLVINMPPSLDIGSTGDIATEGYYQTNNVTYTGESRLGAQWVYGKVFEDIDEQTIATTGIALGANTGFSQAGEVAIFAKNGTTSTNVPALFSKDGMVPDTTDIYDIGTNLLRYGTIYANNLNLNGNITLGDQTSDTITIGARFSSSMVPDTTDSYDIGTDGLRWQDIFGKTGHFDTALNTTAAADFTMKDGSSVNVFFVDGATGNTTIAGEVTVGGGYGSTGVTVSAAGNISANGTLTIDSTSTLSGEVQVGGGYGSTGTTLSDSGNISANGTLTIDSTSTLSGEVQVGGGYGNTGVTISTAGAISADGNIITGGTLQVDSTATFSGTATFNSLVDLGNEETDYVTFTGNVDSNILPDATANNRNLGSSGKKWNTVYAGTFDGDTATFSGAATFNGLVDLGNEETDYVTFTGNVDSNILPDATANNRNLGSSGKKWNTVYAGTFDGTATKAKYADLAEMYLANAEYDTGTVLVFGGPEEVIASLTKGDRRVAGVVSENPAHLMNAELEGEYPVAIALQGRVPCKVLGKVRKGDLLVTSSIPGYAIVDNNPSVGTVIGKALEDKDDDDRGIIEVVVGRV